MKRIAIVAIAVSIASLAVALLPLSNYALGILAYAVVLGIFGLSVGLTFGYLGYISFGHAAFFGLGAYTAALLSVKLGINFWVAVLIAPWPGVLLGALVGFSSLRVSGAHFAIATLTVAEIVRLIAMSWTDLTRGPLGIIVPRPRIEAFDALGVTYQQYYLIVCIVALGFLVWSLQGLLKSPYGRAWTTIRDAPELALSVGIPTLRFRILNVAISGGIAAFAGALLVPKILVLTPDLFSAGFSATGLLIAVLGGKASLIGPLLGGAVFATLPELLRSVDTYRMAIFAVLLFAIIRYRPDGLASLFSGWLPAVKVRADTATDAAKGLAKAFERPAMTNPLALNGLTRRFGGLVAVSDVSFEVAPQEIFGLIGPNGAGKTTCMSMISGFLQPSSGSVTFDARLQPRGTPHLVAKQGLIRTFQQSVVCRGASAIDNVLCASHLLYRDSLAASAFRTRAFLEREAERLSHAHHCLALVGLSDRAAIEAASLSYGEQRLLSIAVALAARPKLLLLDEPAAGLNPTEANKLAALLRSLRDEGLTVIIVDHNLRMMMSVCDRIAVLQNGRKLTEGTPTDIQANAEVAAAYLGKKVAADA